MVTIVRDPAERRGAVITLLATAGIAVVVLAGWAIWKDEPPPVGVQRTIEDVEVTWRCENGHEFRAAGSMTPIECPTCGAPSDVFVHYRCPEHGELPALVRFRLDSAGRQVPDQVRLGDREWWGVTSSVQCPQCGRGVAVARDDPFTRAHGRDR